MEVYCIVNRSIKLSEPTKKIVLQEPLAYDNANAHAMQVTVFNDDGTEADLVGVGVTASFMKADNDTVTPINGEIVENENGVLNIARVLLPPSCYVTPGRYKFTMNLSKSGGYNRTALWVEGKVERNVSGDIIDPGTPVGNISQAIGNANAAAASANNAATAATTAATAASEAAQGVNDIVLVQETQPESDSNKIWVKSESEEAQIPTYEEFEDLKSAINIVEALANDGEYTITQADLERGVWLYTNPDKTSTTRLKSVNLIPVKNGMKVNYTTTSGHDVYFGVAPTPTSGASDFLTSGWVTGTGVYTIPQNGYMTFNNRKSDNSAINVADYASTVTISSVSGIDFNSLKALAMKAYGSSVYDSASAVTYFGNGKNANDAPVNTHVAILQLGLGIANLPGGTTYEQGVLITFCTDTNQARASGKSQVYITSSGISTRYQSSGVWSSWSVPNSASALLTISTSIGSGDLNDYTTPGIYYNYIGGTALNTPYGYNYQHGYVLTVVDKSPVTLQYIDDLKGRCFSRYKSNDTWSAWQQNGVAVTSKTTLRTYIAIGDSITYGRTSDGTERATAPYPTIVGENLNLQIDNQGVTGMGFINRQYAGGVTFYEKVQTVDFTNACLVTIAGGINDIAYPLGSHSDVSGASTICGQMKACIDYILSHSNDYVQIVVISPTRTSADFDYVFQGGGWSIKGDGSTSYEHEIGLICASYNIPMVGWSDMTLNRHWTEICTDGVHPDNEAYKYMGAYITGQISKYFR